MVPEQSTADSSQTSADTSIKMFCLVQASGESLLDHFYVLLQLPYCLAWSIAPALLMGTGLYRYVSTLIKTQRQKQAAA